MRGQPLDIQSMLYTADGKGRCAIVTTAHLSDEERQFVTSLVLSKLVTWMRRQSGTTDLRALLYMDEVAGYLPPTANPPTKKPIMMLMKQARAFGVGVVLATQNPVDVDYKALSNAGTWMVGRLQTERDKQRLLDGMSAAAGGGRRRRGRRHDQRARQARVRAAPRRQGPARGVHDPLGDELPPRPADARPDRMLTPSKRLTPPAAEPASPPPTTAPPRRTAAPATRRAPATARATALRVASTRRHAGDARGRRRRRRALGRPGGAVAGRGRRRSARDASAAGVVARVRLRYDDDKADLVHDEEYEAVLFPLAEHVDATSRRSPSTTTTATCSPSRPPTPSYRLTDAPIAHQVVLAAVQRDLVDHLSRSLDARDPDQHAS